MKFLPLGMAFLLIVLFSVSSLSGEVKIINKEQRLICEKLIQDNCENIKNSVVNDIIVKKFKSPSDKGKFGFPEDIVKHWSLIPIPTEFKTHKKFAK